MEHKEDFFTNNNGKRIYFQCWLPSEQHRGNILLAHGIGEHSGRYQNFAEFFTENGFAVLALDLQGHGKSAGKRGHIPQFHDFVDDLEKLRTETLQDQKDKPSFVLGHSMGGLIAFLYLLRYQENVKGAIFSSPALALKMKIPKWKTILGKIMAKIAPSITMSNEINADFLSHDKSVVTSYKKDELVHDQVSAGLFSSMMEAMALCSKRGNKITVPALLLLGENDVLIGKEGAQEIFNLISSENKETVIIEGAYHEIFNEIDKLKVYKIVLNWLSANIKSMR